MFDSSKKRVGKRILGGLVVLADVAALACIFYFGRHAVYSMALPEGELHWTDSRPEDALMCVPAAYSDTDGSIVGQYIKDGRKYNKVKSSTGRTSIKDNMFYADYKWLSDEGFQQHTLVLDSAPKKFKDQRFKVRRALCKNSKGVFLVQSQLPMSLNSFARKLALNYTNAVNLDMGHCGYGYVKWHGITLPLSLWTYFNRDEQTNWIYVKRPE